MLWSRFKSDMEIKYLIFRLGAPFQDALKKRDLRISKKGFPANFLCQKLEISLQNYGPVSRDEKLDACSHTYPGKTPFSEAETSAQWNHIKSLSNKVAYLSYHSYSQMILYPYGYEEKLPKNMDQLESLAKGMERHCY